MLRHPVHTYDSRISDEAPHALPIDTFHPHGVTQPFATGALLNYNPLTKFHADSWQGAQELRRSDSRLIIVYSAQGRRLRDKMSIGINRS